MTILCVYVDGGKGHYIPARAVQEQLEAMGHKAVMFDFFKFLNIGFAGRVNKYVWRKLLEHSKYEMRFSKHNDQNTREIRTVSRILSRIRMKRLRKMVDEYRPDMIFTTHPYPGYFLSTMVRRGGIRVPVTYYATDVFSVPMSAVCNDLYRMYVSTREGMDSAIANGQAENSVRLCPFPLQASCQNSVKLTKREARKKLGLKEDIFTLQVNFGGEGVGATDLLKGLGQISKEMQVLVIGGIDEKTRIELEGIISRLPANIHVTLAGFVSNVNDYLLACDVIAGRSGINTLVEAFFLRRPFLITELVYTVVASADFVEKYRVGWNASHDVRKQIDIITRCVSCPEELDDLDKNFDYIPITYSARGLAEMIVQDIFSYNREKHQNY